MSGDAVYWMSPASRQAACGDDDVSHGMSMDYVADPGPSKALVHELEMIRKSGSYETGLASDGTPYSLDKQKELIIYRIVQETLNKILNMRRLKKL